LIDLFMVSASESFGGSATECRIGSAIMISLKVVLVSLAGALTHSDEVRIILPVRSGCQNQPSIFSAFSMMLSATAYSGR
jgi:hypothetical protein